MRKLDFDMQLNRAESWTKVEEIVEKTIKAIYPHYYPLGAVRFFLSCIKKRELGKRRTGRACT